MRATAHRLVGHVMDAWEPRLLLTKILPGPVKRKIHLQLNKAGYKEAIRVRIMDNRIEDETWKKKFVRHIGTAIPNWISSS